MTQISVRRKGETVTLVITETGETVSLDIYSAYKLGSKLHRCWDDYAKADPCYHEDPDVSQHLRRLKYGWYSSRPKALAKALKKYGNIQPRQK